MVKTVQLSLLLCLFYFISPINIWSQSTKETLDNTFFRYSVVDMPSASILETITSSRDGDVEMDILGQSLRMKLNPIISPNYVLKYADENGIHEKIGTDAKPMQGKTASGQNASLTFNSGFIYGYIEIGEDVLYVEPLYHYEKSARFDQYVTYYQKDVKPTKKNRCATDHSRRITDDQVVTGEQSSRMGCREVDYAIANDWLMYQQFGQSISAVENHAIGVTNNVQTNWDNEFNVEVVFQIVTQWISTCSTCDPWTNNTDAGILLNSFTQWGPSGFGVTHDLASLWTNRNFDGSTIGIAWLTAICTNLRYNCLQNFTSNAAQKRVLTSHEIGHNFSAQHDGAGSNFIMAPSVNTSNTWSSTSINSINNHIATRTCLANCEVVLPPTANFTWNVTEECVVGSVSFTSTSTNNPTSYSWTFQGGSPSTSTQQNPTILYNSPGVYSVTLTVSNAAGSDSEIKTGIITISQFPNADFTWSYTTPVVSFFDASSNGESFFWEFGDGGSSSVQNPVYNYGQDGVYQVTLSVTNVCGTDTRTKTVQVSTPPVANFTGSPTTGCTPLTVQLQNQSTNNTLSYFWSLPGGTPLTSTEENPAVIYSNAGTYPVTLTALNNQGSNTITKQAFVTVAASAEANFNFATNLGSVTFTNLSLNYTTLLWDFGDGNTSTEVNPVHTYATNGTYIVSLTVSNSACGSTTYTRDVTVVIGVQSAFGVQGGQTMGCSPMAVEFENQSVGGATSFQWIFEGGNPATSTDVNPLVSFGVPGQYDVTLISTDGNTSDTLTLVDYISVIDVPSANFTSDRNGFSIAFTNQSTYGQSYEWDFGNGSISTEENPIIDYGQEGIYTVTQITTNSCGSDTIVSMVHTVNLPTIGFSTESASQICPGDVVRFVDESTSFITGWSWNFPGGTPTSSTEQNPTITYNIPGVYPVTLQATNIQGTSSLTLAGYVRVYGEPEIEYTVTPISPIEYNVSYTGLDTDSYAWILPNGDTISNQTLDISFESNGTYTITVLASNPCSETVSTFEITVTGFPESNFELSNNQACSPTEIQFTPGDLTGDTYEWTFEGGTPESSTEINPTIVYNTPGNYGVTLKVTNQFGVSETVEQNIVVIFEEAISDFEIAYDGSTLSTTNLSQNGSTYLWDFGDGNTSTEFQPTHLYAENGTYTIRLEVTNPCGTVVSTKELEVVVLIPSIDYSYSQSGNCVPFEIRFTDNSSNDPTSWDWIITNGIDTLRSSEQNPIFLIPSAGSYTVILTASNTAGSRTSTSSDLFIANDRPTADFTSDVSFETVSFSNNSIGATSYFWDFGDGQNSLEENPSHDYKELGEYRVTLITTNECGTDTTTQIITILRTGTAETELTDLQIYPNPATEFIILKGRIPSALQEVRIDIFNQLGAQIQSRKFSMSNSELDLNIPIDELSKGIFILKVSTPMGEKYFKFVKI